MVVAFVLLLALVAIALFIARIRPAYPEPGTFLRGMYRYEPDLGWPRGVQEEDGERAWVPASERLASDRTGLEAGTEAGDAETAADEWGPVEPVAVVRVRRG